MKKSISTAFTGILVLALSCGGGGTAGPQWLIDTILSADSVPVGNTVTVTCDISGSDGSDAVQTEVVINPTEGVTLDGHNLTLTRVGDYAVACKVVGTDLVDPTPASLNVFSTTPAKVTAVLDQGTAPAGTGVGVACVVEDEFGNVIESVPTQIDPVEGLEISDHTVSATLAGDYEINCSVDGASGEYVKVPDTLTVVAGDPVKVIVTADPDYKAYAIADTVTIGYEVRDAWNNVVEGVNGSLEAPDKGVKALGDWEFEFEEEGIYPFTVTLAAPWDSISDTLTLYCDESGPDIVIFYPDRGMTFDGDPLITVTGQVTDISGSVDTLKINGEDVDFDEDGKFEYPVNSVHGLNPIVVTATDPFGHVGKVTRGWYYSTAYLPVADDALVTDVVIPEAAMVLLGQDALDDGDHDPAHLDDIATIMEVLLAGIDIPSLLGGSDLFSTTIPNVVAVTLPIQNVNPGLFGDLEVKVAVNDITLGLPHVGLQSLDGGVDAEISFEPVAFKLDITLILHASIEAHNPLDGKDYSFPLLDPGVSTTSGLSIGKLGIQVAMDIEKQPGQPIDVTGKNFNATITDIQIDPLVGLVVDLGSLNLFGNQVNLGKYDLSQLVGGLNDLIANYVLDPLVNFITQPLVDLLEPLVTSLMGDLIKQVVDLLVIDTTFEIPPLLGPDPIPLSIHSDLSSVIFADDGGRVGLNLGVLTKKGVDRDPLGTILRDECNHQDPEAPLYEFTQPPAIQMGLRYDVANEVLFMLWWSGLINQEIDVSSLLGGGSLPIPIDNIVVTPGLLLPPILDDCNSKGTMQIELGDAFLDLKFNMLNAEQHIEAWLQVKITGGIVASDSQIGLEIDKISFLEYEFYDVGGNMGDLMSLVEGLIPALLGQVEGQSFMFDIPPIDLGGLIPGLPPGAVIQLGNMFSTTDKGVAVIGADLL
ncbi:MAG: hypothetical protein GXP54_07130 [Deltaproteobacteria bacterium]|nr:hypothetical protein [Deltaproteobacteria bacterium]